MDSPSLGTFGTTNEQGAPQVFLLEPEKLDADGGLPANQEWVRALLPIRPNQTSGYLKVEDLEIVSTDFRIEVDRSAFELTVYAGKEEFMKVPIGLGTGETPTPVGRFYLASLLQPPDPTSVYGVYAYGLSGYSETLLDWKGGGVIGLHGTNDPESIGSEVSHGCIRMLNEDIEKLV
ncbi:MAG: L,D-transpeptidase, partial [Actinobacteria bacterium]|nr:L,D-transpeptidase [Actinomycetota bacterium]